MLYSDAETGCCLRFNPKPWDKQVITWKDKLFLHDHILSVFHVPVNFGQVVVKNLIKIQKSDALAASPLLLSDENSRWGAEIYIAVSKPVPGADIVKLSGTFLTRVFEGSFRHIGTWMQEMDEFIHIHSKSLRKLYFYYTTCPACAKFYGKNYVVLVAQV